jgi:polysaccharide deacetylase family protein (PEP-CTERM system associated)
MFWKVKAWVSNHKTNMEMKTHNALTIDLEDWYHALISTSRHIERWPNYENRVVANTERLLDLLSRFGVKATFFVLGYVAQQYPDLIRRIANEDHEIALHSYYHQRVYQLKPDQFREDIERTREVVQRASDKRVQGYRAPMFSIKNSSLWVLEALCKMGFRYDSSIFPIRNMYYGIPEAPRFPYQPFNNSSFVEFPLATIKMFGINWPIGGGLYLRTLPYSIIRGGIRKLNRQGKPAILYVHPWEFDLEQRFNKMTPRERITHYHGRASLEGKIIRLMGDFKFAPLSDLLDTTS